jgi:enoyl-CoA hydratase/carnithine racemase
MKNRMVRFRQEGGVGFIELIHPVSDQNELIGLTQELSDCCRKIRANDMYVVVAVTEGSPEILAMAHWAGTGSELGGSVSQAIAECDKPVIIGIRGDALDLGLEIALACDVRVASETSRFAFRQVKAGRMPSDGGTQRLSRAVGKAKALEMILIGDEIDAQEAYHIGLVSRVVPAEKVTTTVMDLAKDMASKSPVSLQYCKEAIIKGMDLTLEQGIRLEADLYFLMHTTHDREEGIRAFQKKRKPNFEGK